MKFLIILLIFSSINLFSQENNSKFELNPVVGLRFHNNEIEIFGDNIRPKALTSLIAGLELRHQKLPLSLSSYINYYLELLPIQSRSEIRYRVGETREKVNIQLNWKRNNSIFSAGYYWKRRENIATHFTSNSANSVHGLEVSFGYSFQWLDIVFLQQFPITAPDPLGSGQRSILFLYPIGRNSNKENQLFKNKNWTLSGILGMRSFIPNHQLLRTEGYNNKFGFASTIGLEFLWKRYHTSLNLEKDWWISFNAGLFTRDIKGYIANSFVGLKHHFLLKNQRHLRVGMGGSWTEDFESKKTLIEMGRTQSIEERTHFINYQVIGLGITLSYEILLKVDIEAKTIIPLARDKGYYIRRTSLGILYRLNNDN